MESDLFSNALRNFFDEVIAEIADEPDLQSSIQQFVSYLNRWIFNTSWTFKHLVNFHQVDFCSRSNDNLGIILVSIQDSKDLSGHTSKGNLVLCWAWQVIICKNRLMRILKDYFQKLGKSVWEIRCPLFELFTDRKSIIWHTFCQTIEWITADVQLCWLI